LAKAEISMRVFAGANPPALSCVLCAAFSD
jgi:hypothetical protein